MVSFTRYFKSMMILATISLLASFILAYYYYYGAAASMITMSFCFWFGGIMAPEDEKYKRKFKRNHQQR